MRPIVYSVTAADVSNGFTVPLPTDFRTPTPGYGVQYLTSGGSAGAGTVQSTLDDPFNAPSGGLTWTNLAATNGRLWSANVARAFRVLTPTAGDVVTVVQQGGSTG